MSRLRDMQCAVGRAILGHDEETIVEAILGDGLTPAQRLGIHRNHYVASLTAALQGIYPVVCRLVDERFFAFAADRFIQAAPPRRPCLFEYGEDFPAFLADFPACAGLPYLADVARLEWAINAALHAPLDAPLEPASLAAVPVTAYASLVFRLQPSLRLLASPWPVDRIWLANQPGAADEDVELASGGCRLEIRQQGDTVVFRRLDESDFALRAALVRQRTLEDAAAPLLADDPLFDLAPALRRLLAEGLVTGFTLAEG